MIQDPEISQMEVGRLVEDWLKIDEDHYLDGPVTPRVAVIDLNPNTEALEPGAVFIPPEGRRTLGSYKVDRKRIYSAHFIQVSVFATVLRTMYMYEEQDTLGRRVAWGFDAPQLLVVPRAGWWANAYYERRSHSLQFFSFRAGNKLIHTSLSRDIVAHETAHALIDGIDPDLYDALDPQSLALHEGVADLTAVLIAFRSGKLRRAVLDKTDGSIEKSTNFSSIGEQFGRAIDPSGQAGWLRNLLNEDKLDPDGDPADEPEEHELSQVITGVLYRFLTVLHTDYKRGLAERFGTSTFAVSGRALFGASEQFKRMILRGLDYLPPGEVTFADYGRAILAADQASFEDDTWRRWLRENFVSRGIVREESDLDVETNVPNRAIRDVDLQGLVDSDWVAYTFAEKNRELLGIPRRRPVRGAAADRRQQALRTIGGEPRTRGCRERGHGVGRGTRCRRPAAEGAHLQGPLEPDRAKSQGPRRRSEATHPDRGHAGHRLGPAAHPLTAQTPGPGRPADRPATPCSGD